MNGLGVNFYFGGTSLLIVVGVAMDTVNQIESQLIMRHYEGFTSKGGRIKGRRPGHNDAGGARIEHGPRSLPYPVPLFCWVRPGRARGRRP